jgi:archaemetzincin
MSSYKIYILPMGFDDAGLIEHIRTAVEETFRFPAHRLSPQPNPFIAFNAARGQYSSTAILRRMPTLLPPDSWRALCVTGADLYVPHLTYVFGEATVDGGYSVISTARLKPEFYGEPKNDSLFLKRAVTEAVHELGHTFGLHHCTDLQCVMCFSNNITDTDRKSSDFCNTCIRQLSNKFSSLDSAA